eukprot:8285276-Alexandrium_andersonii.AAC.1
MSASLVGSEMCIRDSFIGESPNRQTKAHSILHRQVHNNARTFGAATVPVSYTHLTLPTICSV